VKEISTIVGRTTSHKVMNGNSIVAPPASATSFCPGLVSQDIITCGMQVIWFKYITA